MVSNLRDLLGNRNVLLERTGKSWGEGVSARMQSPGDLSKIQKTLGRVSKKKGSVLEICIFIKQLTETVIYLTKNIPTWASTPPIIIYY